jgi:hypothetical protein
MEHVLYAYIARPTTTQIGCFLRALKSYGVSISHLGKSDPPRKFGGSIEDAINLVFSSTDLTNCTFMRDASLRLNFDIQIHHDPGWTHSTLSASSIETAVLGTVAEIAATSFVLFIAVRGAIGGGKEQPWEVLRVTEACPIELRERFIS